LPERERALHSRSDRRKICVSLEVFPSRAEQARRTRNDFQRRTYSARKDCGRPVPEMTTSQLDPSRLSSSIVMKVIKEGNVVDGRKSR
jgi:hypothetical protein